jgi:diguanylate cyclase
MHKGAAVLLQRVADELAISANEFDQFNNALDRMRLEIQSLWRELVETAQNRDPLTGARTRASLISDLREQHALARRGVQQCKLAMIDLDHFKEVNDRHGHAAGDAVLASTLQCMQAIVRPYDRIYRYRGEEFPMCMPNTTVNAALAMAERLRTAVAAQQIGHGSGPASQVTASFGVAALDATHPVEESIDRADHAMYRAKAAGRNRVEPA